MGLLDDAIREHLELKRLRGADPGLVSREEHEAFGPIQGGEPADAQDAIPAQEDPAGDGTSSAAHDLGQPQGFPHGQETAELDMQAVLEDEPVRAGPLADSAPRRGSGAGDSLEWEMPGDEASRGSAGQPAEGTSEDPAADEPVEDVLEETPDFLRDTPEQERLWFEQRPPRDFDFDK